MTTDSIKFLHSMGWHECLGLWFTPEDDSGYSLDAALQVARKTQTPGYEG